MKENKEVKISYLTAHLTTIVSVTLVLLIIGIIAMISIGASGETNKLRRQVEVTLVMADSVSDATAQNVARNLKTEKGVNTVKLITSAQAVENWKADTGEDLVELFGVNILSPEITFTLQPAYASADSIKMMETRMKKIPGVEMVAGPDVKMLDSMNANIEKLSLILGAIAIVMLVISLVLINNTIHLTIYSRRFTIHTMQLVGATNSFIRRPFLLNNMLSGLIAGLLAAAIIATVLAFAPKAGFDDISIWMSWEMFGFVAGGMVFLGVVVCGAASWLASTRFLRKDYGDLFK